MGLVNKRVTPDELAERLAASRKVMRKVENNDYERGNINEQQIISNDPEMVMDDERPVPPVSKYKVEDHNPDRIKESRLPDAIKQAMIEHPIPKISLNDGIDIDMVSKAKKIMERDGSIPKSSNKQTIVQHVSSGDLEKKLTPIIENIISKTLDKIVETKLNQILAAQQIASLNENLAIKVGDSLFQGKITSVKTTKNKK